MKLERHVTDTNVKIVSTTIVRNTVKVFDFFTGGYTVERI